MDVVRKILGLPPITMEELRWGIEAACDDMEAAVGFVRANQPCNNGPVVESRK